MIVDHQSDILDLPLSDFQNIHHQEIQPWLVNHEIVPDNFQSQLQIDDHSSLRIVLENIRRAMNNFYGSDARPALSLEESRFLPLSESLTKKIQSCGVRTNLFGTILRTRGVPVQYVHGQLEHQQGSGDRHAWLKIFHPQKKTWIDVDPSEETFTPRPDSKEFKIYHDWLELQWESKE